MAASPFQRAARQRWPRHMVSGDGAFAVVCPVTSIVKLYDWAMLALVEAGQQHSNWNCAADHKVVEIEPTYEPTKAILNLPAEVEPD